MNAPNCPGCGEPLDRVLDVPYGYWQWNGSAYELKSTSERVDVSPWACASCLAELREFHPQDVVANRAERPGNMVDQ